MPFRERATRTGLQVPLESDRALFIVKLDEEIDLPRPTISGVLASACVVVSEPALKFRREARVVAAWFSETSQNIDDALGFVH